MLQMYVANRLSFFDFCIVTIHARRLAKRWCRKKVAFQRTAAANSQGHFDENSACRTGAQHNNPEFSGLRDARHTAMWPIIEPCDFAVSIPAGFVMPHSLLPIRIQRQPRCSRIASKKYHRLPPAQQRGQ